MVRKRKLPRQQKLGAKFEDQPSVQHAVDTILRSVAILDQFGGSDEEMETALRKFLRKEGWSDAQINKLFRLAVQRVQRMKRR